MFVDVSFFLKKNLKTGRLALEIMRDVKKVHSFDLVAKFPHITATDMANVPLPDASVDVGVFCLALMGTNWEGEDAHKKKKVFLF